LRPAFAPLRKPDVEELLVAYVDPTLQSENGADRMKASPLTQTLTNTEPLLEGVGPPPPVRMAEEAKSAERAVPNAPKIRTELFTQSERSALSKAVSRALASGVSSATPRQVRAFLAKYQLARALCGRHLARDPDMVSKLANGLAEAVFRNAQPSLPPEKKDGVSAIEQVIAEVV
jgi:hypothetical protein